MEEVRLQKYISSCGIMSRRAAEKEIQAGHIFVNGEPAVLGQKIKVGEDSVKYNGKLILMQGHQNIYIMLNKPRGYVTTMSDEKGRPIVTDLIRGVPWRVYPVGRLDMDSEGLLLLTNDGEFANRLTHPGHEVSKVYHVKVASEVSAETLKSLSKPMQIDGYDLKPGKVDVIVRGNRYTVLRMELFEGRNRQIRKMCESLNLKVLLLRRVSVGALSLGDLPIGQWCYLTPSQIQMLK